MLTHCCDFAESARRHLWIVWWSRAVKCWTQHCVMKSSHVHLVVSKLQHSSLLHDASKIVGTVVPGLSMSDFSQMVDAVIALSN